MIYKLTRRELLKYGVKAGILAFGVPTLLKLMEQNAYATTYFGCNSIGTQLGGGYTTGNNVSTNVYTCPGSGSQTIDALEAYVYNLTGMSIRLAVYNTSGNLICSGTSAVTPTLTTGGWYGHNTAGLTGTTTLTGGTAYQLVLSTNSAGYIYWNTSGPACVCNFTDYYTSGFPGSLTLSTNFGGEVSIRCGVSAVGGGGGGTTIKHRVIR